MLSSGQGGLSLLDRWSGRRADGPRTPTSVGTLRGNVVSWVDLAVRVGIMHPLEAPMPRLSLSEPQRQELIRLRETAPKPYQRERAAALLKIDAGLPPARVAREGLHRPRKPDTLYEWLRRFEAEGLSGLLKIRPGRGRKPAFSPSLPPEGGGPADPAACRAS
jgi:Winged helix-turn helix